MVRSHIAYLAASLLSLPLLSEGYQWPDPIDAIEELYAVTDGLGASNVVFPITPCGFSPLSTSGRQAAAEWIRTAYHDMATADAAAGTGGIDASLGFETDRGENVGPAFNTTMGFLATFQNSHASLADLIALGTVLSVRICSGPSVPMRVGRVDATSAGPFGVPEPQQDLASHTASFAKQGFNVSEMIGLVACGHTIGGVHETEFPTVVTGLINSDNNTSGMQHFDDSFSKFDNHIAVQWVNSSTSDDALATGFNTTMDSDARIFAADNNATMRDLASSNDVFNNRCGELLGRMLDTVPKGVTLTDPIAPVPVKPWNAQLSIDSNGNIQLEGNVRIFSSDPAETFDGYTVNIAWTDRNGASCDGCTAAATFQGTSSGTIWDGAVRFFQFNTTIDPAVGFSAFTVQFSTTAGGAVTTADNNGAGFAISDGVMVQPATSCVMSDGTVNIVAAVRNDQTVSSASVSFTSAETQVGSVGRLMVPSTASLTRTTSSASSLYDLYSAQFVVGIAASSSFDLSVDLGGTTHTDAFNLVKNLNSC